jgi:hypothetical protein
MQHRLTWLAIILSFLFLIPGELVGWVVAAVYRYSAGAIFFSGDTVFDWATKGWFSLVSLEWCSSAGQGFIAGAFAVFAAAKIVKNADYTTVAYTNSALVIVFTLLGAIVGIAKYGLRLEDFAMLANTVGLIAGLFTLATQIGREQSLASQ